MADLTGRIALVTGASGGIGAETARALAAAGAKVAVTDLTAPDALAAEIVLGSHVREGREFLRGMGDALGEDLLLVLEDTDLGRR